jgi:hypothetical protein
MNCVSKRNGFIVVLVMSIAIFSAMDTFGQFGRLRRNNINNSGRQPITRQSVNVDIILESNSSSRKEWEIGKTKGEKPIKKVIEEAKDPGSSDIVSWDFGERRKSSPDRVTNFRFTFYDSDNESIETGFTFYPKEGKVRFEYGTGAGLNWDIDKENTENLKPTKRVVKSPNMPGASTIDEWTLGTLLNNVEDEGTAVFKFNYRDYDYTEIKVRLKK